jgi:TIGR00730 family protein
MKRIGVFCSASDRLEAGYYEKALEVGRWLGAHGKVLVYGGANSGIMERLAQGVKETGGHVVGVVPSILESRRRVSRWVDEVVPCNDLNERKALMVEQSDILVALPGGVGTLDEIFTVLAAHSIGYHRKKVIVYNEDGFWDSLLRMLDEMDSRQFMNTPLADSLVVVRSLSELSAQLD